MKIRLVSVGLILVLGFQPVLGAESTAAMPSLSRAEVQELFQLSKQFKNYLVDYELARDQQKEISTKLDNEQKVINADMNQLSDDLKAELQKTKEELHTTQLYVMIAGGILGLFVLLK